MDMITHQRWTRHAKKEKIERDDMCRVVKNVYIAWFYGLLKKWPHEMTWTTNKRWREVVCNGGHRHIFFFFMLTYPAAPVMMAFLPSKRRPPPELILGLMVIQFKRFLAKRRWEIVSEGRLGRVLDLFQEKARWERLANILCMYAAAYHLGE